MWRIDKLVLWVQHELRTKYQSIRIDSINFIYVHLCIASNEYREENKNKINQANNGKIEALMRNLWPIQCEKWIHIKALSQCTQMDSRLKEKCLCEESIYICLVLFLNRACVYVCCAGSEFFLNREIRSGHTNFSQQSFGVFLMAADNWLLSTTRTYRQKQRRMFSAMLSLCCCHWI